MKNGYDRLGRQFKPQTAQRMCFDKVPYACRNEARDAAAHLKKTRGYEVQPYRCLVCRRYHLTSLNKEDGAAARARIWK